MTIAFWCVLAAAMLPYLTIAIGKYGRRYDNRSPRDWEARLEGKQRRAVFAHYNHFEAFAPFAAAVIVAHLAGASQAGSNTLAASFIALRIAYTWAYVADKHILRSLLWAGGMSCVVGLFAAGAAAGQ
ncbi:MAG: MAPEG family protein [Usitatibacter sp.]